MSPEERRELLSLLEAHRPWDAAESAHLDFIRGFARRHADPFDRRLAEGHLTGSAFVLDPAGRLLLTHHARLGLWVQLGGHADAERRAEAVALREAREESGLSDLDFHDALRPGAGAPALLDVDVHAIPARGAEPAHLHLDLRFLLRTARPCEARRDPGESRALEWVTLEDCRRRCDAGVGRAVARIEAVLARA